VVKLRGHHLICLHFFKPEALGEAFASKVREALTRLERGEEALIVEGGDDVCVACPYFKDGRCAYAEGAEEEVASMDGEALSLLGLQPGSKVSWSWIKQRLPSITAQWRAKYCAECEWRTSCWA